MQPRLRVLIVEDEPKLAFALRTLFDYDGRCEVIASVSNGQDGVEQALKLRPDIVLMDIRMPVMDGHAAAQLIRDAWTEAVIVVYSGDPAELERARQAGLAGTLVKGSLVWDLVDTVVAAAG